MSLVSLGYLHNGVWYHSVFKVFSAFLCTRYVQRVDGLVRRLHCNGKLNAFLYLVQCSCNSEYGLQNCGGHQVEVVDWSKEFKMVSEINPLNHCQSEFLSVYGSVRVEFREHTLQEDFDTAHELNFLSNLCEMDVYKHARFRKTIICWSGIGALFM